MKSGKYLHLAGILPKRVHGSALFQRGLTQVLSTTTLGTPSDAQEMDDLNPSTEKTYLHHYNFSHHILLEKLDR